MKRSQKHNKHEFCSEPLELVENYKQALADDFEGWCIHHRLEIQPDGTRVSRQELKDNGLYYGRPASELIFMRNGEHTTLHWLGKHHSTETCKKIAESKKGKHRSADTCKKIAESNKGKHHSAESRQKMSKSWKGKYWWNNWISSKRSRECPGEGWTRGRLRFK